MDLNLKVELVADQKILTVLDKISKVLEQAISAKQLELPFDSEPEKEVRKAVIGADKALPDKPETTISDVVSEVPTLIEVRAVAAEKARSGKRKEANEIVLSYGVKSITELMKTTPEQIIECYTRLSEL